MAAKAASTLAGSATLHDSASAGCPLSRSHSAATSAASVHGQVEDGHPGPFRGEAQAAALADALGPARDGGDFVFEAFDDVHEISGRLVDW